MSAYIPKGDAWFARSAHDIIAEMGFVLERGKVNNLVSFGNGSIDLWGYLCLLPKEHRAEIGEEWVNFILGPLAAALKVDKLGFEDRNQIIHTSGVYMLLEAMALGLVPSGKRKELYEALLTRYNTEAFPKEEINLEKFDPPLREGGPDPDFTVPKARPGAEANLIPHAQVREMLNGWIRRDMIRVNIDEEDARVAFYTILADVLAPIFDEASGDELGAMIDKVLADNPKQAGEAKGDPKIVGWLMGQVMRGSPVKLDPNTVRAAILERM